MFCSMMIELSRQPSRGELMRQLAALYAQFTIGFGKERRPEKTRAERDNIKRQIAVLEKRLMEH